MERLVDSFVNYTFTIGEWLIEKRALTKEIIQDMDGEVIIGIPSLAILNCIEGTSQFIIILFNESSIEKSAKIHLNGKNASVTISAQAIQTILIDK